MRSPTRSAVVAVAAPALGFALGLTVTLTDPDRHAPLWSVWMPLAVGLTTAAGSVFAYGLRRWADLRRWHEVRVRDAAAPVAGLVIVAAFLVNAGALFPKLLGHGSARGGLLTTFAVLMAAPAALVMYGIRYTAQRGSLSDSSGGQIAALVTLRRLLERLLAAAGPIVALTTLQHGALMALESSVHAAGTRPPQYILIYGGFGSLLAGLIYVPAWAALRDRGLLVCDQELSLGKQTDLQAILSTADQRQKLEQVLGTDRNLFADLQTGLAILAPLLASAAVAFLPH